MKQVYLYDEHGFYTETYLAQESPLEEGTYIVPSVATDLPPPSLSGSQQAQFINGSWSIYSAPDTPPIVAPPLTLPQLKSNLLIKIDANTDAIYSAVIGARGNEYNDASAQALAFKTAGYTGSAGNKVQSLATAKGWTTTQSADSILDKTSAWKAVEDGIRANRLLQKESAKIATSQDGLSAIEKNWDNFIVATKKTLGIV